MRLKLPIHQTYKISISNQHLVLRIELNSRKINSTVNALILISYTTKLHIWNHYLNVLLQNLLQKIRIIHIEINELLRRNIRNLLLNNTLTVWMQKDFIHVLCSKIKMTNLITNETKMFQIKLNCF